MSPAGLALLPDPAALVAAWVWGVGVLGLGCALVLGVCCRR